ncbi:MAG: hypothetical protein WKF92_12100 [Pyrinomonadaceae bacterium]
MSAHPLDVDLARPTSRLQPSTIREGDGTEVALSQYEKHLLCDKDGLYPDEFNAWERPVLRSELNRSETVAWYRNPDRPSQDSLGITYWDDNEIRIVRPDFIFFANDESGKIVADIVDPHSFHLADALPKLKGLANYAAAKGGVFRRIDAVAVLNDHICKVLDLKEERVRDAIFSATSAQSLYESPIAEDYVLDGGC